MPRTSDSNAPHHARVQEMFHADLFEHIWVITDATAIISASNKVAGARELINICPNYKIILRGAAQSALRVLQKR